MINKIKKIILYSSIALSSLSCTTPEPIDYKNYQPNIDSLNNVMNKKSGLELKLMQKNSMNDSLRDVAKTLVNYFTIEHKRIIRKNIKEMLPPQIYEKFKVPSSISINTDQELKKVIEHMHKVSYYHYALAKDFGWEKIGIDKVHKFPEYSCGNASKNVAISLFNDGYISAVEAHDSEDDHAYVILPVIFKGNKSVIILDPTSDQLFLDKSKKIPNKIFFSKPSWTYITDWHDGANLYPDQVDTYRDLTFGDFESKIDYPIKEYLEQAYKTQYNIKELPIKKQL